MKNEVMGKAKSLLGSLRLISIVVKMYTNKSMIGNAQIY